MATSESDDFESADEEMNHNAPMKRIVQSQQWNSPTTIDSESDDDTEYVPRPSRTNIIFNRRTEKYHAGIDKAADEKRLDKDISIKDMLNEQKLISNTDRAPNKVSEEVTSPDLSTLKTGEINTSITNLEVDKDELKLPLKSNVDMKEQSEAVTSKPGRKSKDQKQPKLGARKLGTKITQSENVKDDASNVTCTDKENTSTTQQDILLGEFSVTDELTESNMPEEMKSDKKFKEVFKPEGWEGLGNEIELPEELTEEKLQPILKRLSASGQDSQNSWGWSNWNVTSLINTASAGVSTLTSHVSHGLTLLEEPLGIPDESTPTKTEEEEEEKEESSTNADDKKEQAEEQSIFGFGSLISSMSSITKLVETTGTKVVTGGLDTLEAIGKKTMEVLQEGDPGLKKKRAFFLNETDKPNLSEVIQKAKSEAVQNTTEEEQRISKVHFESLFDDYQGLVHLKALEMLSEQSKIKIQLYLMNLDTNELNSAEETLEDVKALCDLGEDDESETETHDKDLKCRLQEACSDLGINITYEKLHDVSEASEAYTTPPVTYTAQEIFEHAISVLAQFAALSVERFHKTAELLLIKEHRSTVNEADALVRLTQILSKQVGVLANTYCSSLNDLAETSDKTDNINSNVTTIFMEASNASSYIQDAFKLLIPIIQVGAI